MSWIVAEFKKDSGIDLTKHRTRSSGSKRGREKRRSRFELAREYDN